MFNMKNFKTVMGTQNSKSMVNPNQKPMITFNSEDGYVAFNKKALNVVSSPTVVLMEDAINQLIAIVPTSCRQNGVRSYYTPNQKKNGGTKWADEQCLNIFFSCESVSMEGIYHFEGEWDDESKVLIFDLKKGRYAGRVKRRKQAKQSGMKVRSK